MEQTERIAQTIQEYDSQGWHRTGTPTDHASARWLAAKARELGAEVELERFGLSRIDPGECYLEVDGQRIAGLPMYDGTFTGPEGVHGRLGEPDSACDIALTEVRRGVGANVALQAARESTDLKGVVAVTMGGGPGLMATNAPGFWTPSGPPVLQVESRTQDLLKEHARRGSAVRLVAPVTRSDADSFNVVARLKGRDEGLPPLVVMTPRSGWYHCASERGGGIACWLEVMRALGEVGPPCDVIFVATSAHELGFYGADAFLEHRAGLVQEARAWIHFGASIGAAQDPDARLSATDDDLEQRAGDALRRLGPYPATHVARGTTVGGESQTVAAGGGRVVAMVGGNAQFHLETDRWPDAVDAGAVAGFASAFVEVARGLVEG